MRQAAVGGRWARPLILALLLAAASPGSAETTPVRRVAGVEIAELEPPDLEHLEAAVATQLRATLDLLESIAGGADPQRRQLAEAFGAAGRLFHAYDITDPAATCYGNAALLAPEDFRWAYYLATVARQQGRLDAAIEAYRKSLAIEPRNLAAWVYLGETYLASRRLEEARAALEQALELDPGSAAALASLGQVELSEKRYAAAVEHLEAALAATPDADRLHHPLGLAYRGLGEMDKARQHLARRGKVGVRPPDSLMDQLSALKVGERVFLLRGQMAFRSGRYSEAIEAFQAALSAAPDSIRARVNLATALAGSGQTEAAIDRFREVLRRDSDNKAAHFNLGVLLLQSGSYAAAAESLTAAVELDPADAEALLELARAERRLGRWERSAAHAARVIELDPANEAARLLEAQVLVRQGSYSAALQRLEAAYEVMSEAGRIVGALAKLLAASPDLALRDGPRAVRLASLVYGTSRDPRHAELVALALAETGRCAEAEGLQRRAVEDALQAGAEDLARSLGETLTHLEKRPCRFPGGA